MSANYPEYVDDMLVAIADAQVGPNVLPIDLDVLHHEKFREAAPTWLQLVIKELESRGYGAESWDAGNSRKFVINGAGLAKAHEIRAERLPKPLIDRLAADRTQKLLNVGAFVVSIISLFVAIFALFKAGS